MRLRPGNRNNADSRNGRTGAVRALGLCAGAVSSPAGTRSTRGPMRRWDEAAGPIAPSSLRRGETHNLARPRSRGGSRLDTELSIDPFEMVTDGARREA